VNGTAKRIGELVFIGLGLEDERGMTLKGLEEAKSADLVFAEFYTSTLKEGSVARLEKSIGKSIIVLGRKEVEDGRRVLEQCPGKKVALLIAGDPMTATTHIDLRIRARMASIETRVVHGASVLSAVPGLLGLQHYKFGRTTTLPFPQEGYNPISPYETICENISRGLHTLVLLDIDAEGSRYMTANEGLLLLEEMERRVKRGAITGQTLVAVVARAGSDECVVRAGPLDSLKTEEFGPPLHTIVVPGTLHFMEDEALRAFAGMTDSQGEQEGPNEP
jgi:diphthine synthase